MSLIPIYVFEKDTELPDNGTYFVIAANGTFMHKDTGIIKALIKFDLAKVPMLKEFTPKAKPIATSVYVYDDECEDLPIDKEYFVIAKNGIYQHSRSINFNFNKVDFDNIANLGNLKPEIFHFDIPSIPVEVFWNCLLFFNDVWFKHRSEVALILYYNVSKKDYFLYCPKQNVSNFSVDYGNDPYENSFVNEMRQKGYNRIGTIHSHCNFNAFHSSVDEGDEAEWPDGIHITIGNVNDGDFSLASSLVINDNRFQIDPETMIENLIKKPTKSSKNDNFYNVKLTKEEKEILSDTFYKEIAKEWMSKVKSLRFNQER